MNVSILLVDDSKMMRKIVAKELSSIFSHQKLHLTEADSGEKALEFLQESSFDVVFLDLTMPEITGYDVLQSVRKKNIHANIIVLTADIQPEAEKRVRDLGAVGYIKKERPLNTDAITETLQSLDLL